MSRVKYASLDPNKLGGDELYPPSKDRDYDTDETESVDRDQIRVRADKLNSGWTRDQMVETLLKERTEREEKRKANEESADMAKRKAKAVREKELKEKREEKVNTYVNHVVGLFNKEYKNLTELQADLNDEDNLTQIFFLEYNQTPILTVKDIERVKNIYQALRHKYESNPSIKETIDKILAEFNNIIHEKNEKKNKKQKTSSCCLRCTHPIYKNDI